MMERVREAAPRFKARMAGMFYLLSVLSGIFAEKFVHGVLLYAAGLIPVLCFVIVTLILYDIFKPVSWVVAFFAAFFNLTGLFFEAVEWHPLGVNSAVGCHGIYCVLIGLLVSQSTFLPRVLSIPMVVAGLAWLTVLAPRLAHSWHPYTQIIGFAGEGLLMLWFLAMGVDVPRWLQSVNLHVAERTD